MNNDNTYYLKKQKIIARTIKKPFHHNDGKEQIKKDIIKTIKKDCKNKLKINIENYLMKKTI